MVENFGKDFIAAVAREAAFRHGVLSTTAKPVPLPAWKSITVMRSWLAKALLAANAAEPQNASAGEWLLDNDFHVLRSVLQVIEDLPNNFYNQLPVALDREFEGLPRIYFIAHELLHATHLQINFNSVVYFIEHYQDESPLSIAELWAFPTMLRLACLELLVTGFGRLFNNVTAPFEMGPGSRISATVDDTECVSRAIANLIVVSTIEWKDFFDNTSRVEAILRRDSGKIYPLMDFETRDSYRRKIEWLAKHSLQTELSVAEALLDHCANQIETPLDHVGYWLIGEGRSKFEHLLNVQLPIFVNMQWHIRKFPRAIYALSLIFAGLVSLAAPLLYLATLEASAMDWLFAIVLVVIPASLVSVMVVNWLVTLIVQPCILPKLNFSEGIPQNCATAVVVPVLIASINDVPELIQRLEGHYLAARDRMLSFVLLSDHVDANDEILPDDHLLEEALIAGVNRLNIRHGSTDVFPFYLLHRRRLFNDKQGVWMCWERKRGKLKQFNGYVRRGDIAPFPVLAGQVEKLRNVRFVVTADADTRLPPGSISRMVATMDHPLNRARFAPLTGKVFEGFTILQPRVEIYPETIGRSLFTRLFGGDTTIDIYSRAVSDVYQDLIGTGIFVGKGIYEVEAFERSLEGKIPENSLLSHDLFEGVHGRTALASDIIIYEQFSSGYLDFASRLHRWVRGDWQLLPWLFPTVPGQSKKRISNQLSWFERLKIFDNLRRSLVPVGLLAFLIAGWSALPGNPFVWTMFAIAGPATHLLIDVVTALIRIRHRGVLQDLVLHLGDHFGRWILALTFLVNDAWTAATAIVVSFWRLALGRRLLEWTSAAHMSSHFAGLDPRRAAWRHMWVSPVFAIMVSGGLALHQSNAMLIAAPILLLWLAAPEIAIWINRPIAIPAEKLNHEEQRFLRGVARRTWLFFETFVGPADNWLPPDNYQEPPDEAIAHRTSPTNIGMMLLSILAAWKLGYIGLSELEIRLNNTINTLDRLKRHRGHILNWYHTRTLEPLEPRYVSTVDSGNLAVSLVVVQQACLDAANSPAISVQSWDGLTDTIDQLVRVLETRGFDPSRNCRDRAAEMNNLIFKEKNNIYQWVALLDQLQGNYNPELKKQIQNLMIRGYQISVTKLREAQVWSERIDHHLLSMRRDIDSFMPWLRSIVNAPEAIGDRAIAVRQTLTDAAVQDLPNLNVAFDQARELLREDDETFMPDNARVWIDDVLSSLDHAVDTHQQLRLRLEDLANRASEWAHRMEFGILFDNGSRLFHIGYNVSADRIDTHHYDLMASEARLASFFAIAKGDVPLEHWSYLGRPITKNTFGLSLVSWNGSMFEYLMPDLFLRSEAETLLGQSDRTAVDLQIDFGNANNIPWGISESAYALMGADRTYNYHAFGIPRLGLRRGLGRDLVIAPYATSLALATRPLKALRNLQDMAALGLEGRYGFYEAADFTPGRVPDGQLFVPVRSYMAHHHGMSLAAIGNALCDDMFVRWFHGDAYVRTIDLLLNERIPWELPPEIERIAAREAISIVEGTIPNLQPWAPISLAGQMPIHVIGNGRMTAQLTANGGSQLRLREYTLTGNDNGLNCSGLWVYVRDLDSGELWSVTPQPTRAIASDVRISFQGHQVEYHARYHDIAITMTVAIAHGDDLEIRRIAIVNESNETRRLDLTSYGEVVLAVGNDAARHPVFSKMFVNSELLNTINGLLFTRRPRGPEERPPVLLHRVIADDIGFITHSADTDRAIFLGRYGNIDRPAALLKKDLSNTAGWTLDPIMALRAEIELHPQSRREIAFVTIAAGSRESAIEISERYATLAALDWASSDAVSRTAREIHGDGLSPDQLPDAQLLLSHLLQPCAPARSDSDIVAATQFRRQDLWSFGISGNRPILLIRVHEAERIELLRFILSAQKLWRRNRVMVDIVVLHDATEGYLEPVRDKLLNLLREFDVQDALGVNGGIYILGVSPTDAGRAHLMTQVADVALDEMGASLGIQLARMDVSRTSSPRFEPLSMADLSAAAEAPELARLTDLSFDNGLGGFSAEGDYVIHLDAGSATPAPWSNVLANEDFGTIVTEAGLGFSWSLNSGENRLTPWHNDPIRDPQTEILYLRDEENAHLWTTTPLPIGGDSACRIRHSIGHTVWERISEGLEQELLTFVPVDDPVKIVRLRLRNLLPRARRITATYYAEWLLGAVYGEPAPLRTAEYDATMHSLIAHNPWNEDFRSRTAFLTCTLPPKSVTTSRTDFLGREKDVRRPEGLQNWDLGGRTLAIGADCCAAFQSHIEIPPGEMREVCFILGQADNRAHAQILVDRWQNTVTIARALQSGIDHRNARLGAVQVHTPDPAFDVMINRWLPYQTTSSRMWARAGFYQAGGAFGYRDQLQDVLSLLYSAPDEARRHILFAAAHQFEEGDVLHWWHPPQDRGVRTHFSDDMLWLPYVTASYVAATGDIAILHEEESFLHGAELGVNEDDRYALFERTDECASLFKHCERALDRGYRLGAHGLPLIGTGDWNDGMNRVGNRGRGESVWLAWFLIATITGFSDLCDRMNLPELAISWKRRADELTQAVEREAWDGQWYLRAFDDDGRSWGSSSETECRIDSIAQSWSVLSGAGDPVHITSAIASAKYYLVRDDDRLIRLLTPPFDKTPRDPGYIKSYPPGIRENGGQYTHAASWLGIALAMQGDGNGAMELFNRINPIYHTLTSQNVHRYRIEPYVVAADVGGEEPYIGRGGWSWYTGAAGWTWRLAVEFILGLRLVEGKVQIAPCLPEHWRAFDATLKGAKGNLHFRVNNPYSRQAGNPQISVDGHAWPGGSIPFPEDGSTREVRVTLL